ncbi:MAG: ubiquinol-cytochrome C chaperone [Cohaesibacter sp.]|jgi:cytochrome b pre-mRNA-processing protein 3|nr:ubiquinol-cytochrome C chaperone [Cohaesibacter sp.]
MIFNLFKKDEKREKLVDDLYGQIVAQARQPVFYTDYAIPDDINGRFEMILLHVYMLAHRLRGEGEQAQELGQQVFDRFFKDMDHSLREIGIGDLSVPKKIKKMAQAFYGRVEAYDTAREIGREELQTALQRNFFPEEETPPAQSAALADYVIETEETLTKSSWQEFEAGNLAFPVPAKPA